MRLFQKIRTPIPWLVLIMAALTTLACDSPFDSSPKELPSSRNVLRFDVCGTPGSLHPAAVGEAMGATVMFPLLYSRLCVPNEHGQLEPDLALDWQYDSSKRTWTLHLREDATFHDGRQVTSVDVEYSLNTVLRNLRPDLFSMIHRISCPSPSTIQIALDRDYPDFLLGIWQIEILPGEAGRAMDVRHAPAGSGPFRFHRRDADNQVTLVANDDYYLGRPSLDEIILYFEPDPEKSWARLLNDKTDVAMGIYPRDYEMIRDYNNRFNFNVTVPDYYTLLLYNTKDPLFSDVRVRRALSYLVDKSYIIKEILRGNGVIAASPMGYQSPYHNPEVLPVPYDPRKGLDLLHEAGWMFDEQTRYLEKDGQRFEFTILATEGNQIERRVAMYLQLCFNEVGIVSHVKPLSVESLSKRCFRNTEFQAALIEFAGAHTSPEMIQSIWSPSQGAPAAGGTFENEQVTALFIRAAEATTYAERTLIYQKIDALLTSLQPGTFLYQKTILDVVSKRVVLPFPFSTGTVGLYRLKHASIKPR